MTEKINEAIKNLEAVYGKNTVVKLDTQTVFNREVLSTGSLGVDLALGGGVVRGRLVELFGPPSSGKSTLACHIIGEAQKLGSVLYVDVEHSFDPTYAQNLGVNIDNLLISQPSCSEEAFNIIHVLVETGELSLVVIDSVAALVSKQEIENDFGSANMGKSAKLMAAHIRKIGPMASTTKTTILYINQLRRKIGVVFGNPEYTPGGEALRYHASIRLDIRCIATNKDKEKNEQSIRSRVKVAKNKTYPPFKKAEFNIIFGQGVDKYEEVLKLSVEKNVIEKKGSWYNYGEDRMGQGEDAAIEYIKSANIYDELKQGILGGKNETD